MGREVITKVVRICLILQFAFLSGCNEMNRKQFTELKPSKCEEGFQYFDYQASTGALSITCAPNSRVCKITSRRAPIWPVGDPEAEKVRMQWLQQSLADAGYRNADYEILSRDPVGGISRYDLRYDLRVKVTQ